MGESVRFDSILTIRCPADVSAAVSRSAAQRRQKPAEWLRQAIETALHRDGVDPSQERKFALVANGELIRSTFGDGSRVVTTYWPSPTEQGRWLPIENETPAHPGVYPEYRLNGDRVLCSWRTAERA